MPSPSNALTALASIVLLGLSAQAQDACSIELQNDTTVCQGETVLLEGPPGFPNYVWSTGELTQNITVASTGTYGLQVSYPSGELVTNGDFSGGNTGFTTEFIANTNLNTGDGYYWIATNAASHHPQFLGTGTGQFMLVNSGFPSALRMVWCQEVDVCPEQTYTLTFRARTVSNATPARLQWWMDGVPVGPEWNLPLFGAGWQPFTQVWTSPAMLTTANICLRVMSGEGVGNDFAIDDISMQGQIVLTDAVDVTVTPLPVVDLGPDQDLCFGETLVLDATVAGGTYLWQDGSTGPTFTVDQAGTYTVDVTANNCSTTETIDIAYNAALVLDLGADTLLCTGASLLLDATLPGGATYLWQDGSTDATFTVTSAGTYSVTVTRNGCDVTESIDVGFLPLPVVDLGPDQSICAGEQTTLNATTAGASYLWQDGSTNATLVASTAGTYTVDVTVNGCTSSDALDIIVTPLPVVDLGPPQTVCPDTEVLLDATVIGGTYLWQDGSAASTYSVTQPGNYSVTVTANGCGTDASTSVQYFDLPVVDLGADATICEGEAALFGVSIANASYAWSTGAISETISPDAAGFYWVDVTRDGCTVRDSVELFVTPLPVVDLGTAPAVCPGTEITLDATLTGGSYLWSTGATTATIEATPGDYSVEVEVDGCSGTASVTVAALPAPTVELGNDTTLCIGDELVLDVEQSGATYSWSTGATTPDLSVSAGGTYSVTVTDANSCSTSDAIDVVFVVPVPVDLGADITVCEGDEVVLDASTPGANYLWSTGETTATITVLTGGPYSVEVAQGSCSESGSIEVTFLDAPVVDLGTQSTLCPGDVSNLDATTAGATYLWNTGDTTPTLEVDAGGTYSVEVTDAFGCSTTASIEILDIQPDAVDLGGDVELCAGGTVVLDATLPAATYTWNTGATTATLVVDEAGTYWVDALQTGCTASDTVVVSIVDPGTVDLGPDVTLCAGGTIELDATLAGATYLWNDGSTDATLQVMSTGNYSVEATVGQCSVSDAIQITFTPLPTVDLGGDVELCPGASALFDASIPGGTYLWNDGSTASTFSSSDAGEVFVTVTVAGCSASDTVLVSLLEAPEPDLGSDTLLCAGSTLLLDVTEAGSTYLWDDGLTLPTRLISEAGTYWVRIERNTCIGSDTISVAYFDPSFLELGGDIILCPGETATLETGLAGPEHLWSTGATSTSIEVDSTGDYWVEVLVAGCSARDTVSVVAVELLQPDLGLDREVCSDEVVELTVESGDAAVLWSTGSNATSILVTETDTYTVTLSQDGCSAEDQVTITIRQRIDDLDLPAEMSICPGRPFILQVADLPDTEFLWSTGAVGASILVLEPGSYTVQATGICVDAEATVVVVPGDCEPVIFVPNAFTPNMDGFNDAFLPSVQGPVEDYRLDVFDRWGEMLFTTTDRWEGWDGSYGGVASQDGVYIWTINYTEFTELGITGRRLVGHVTLLR